MKTITSLKVSEVEKRRIPSKHYVYVIYVTWSDGGQYVIYRRYSRFFDLQSTLLEKFPIEAGSIEPSERIIPILPGKILFGRSHIREVALKRLQPIDEYCQTLIGLTESISQCDEVLTFFEVEPEDLDPPKEDRKSKSEPRIDKISKPKQLKQYTAIADYEKQDRGEVTLHAGMVVEVVEQSETGWWFVNSEEEQGWVPSTYLQPVEGQREDTTRRAKPGEEERYICIEQFTGTGEDEVSLEKGAIVEVVEKNLEGWWMIRHQGREGWAPATYLCKTKDKYAMSLVEKGRSSGVEIIGTLSDISNLLKQSNEASNNDDNVDNTEEDHAADLYTKVNKTRSMERGGSLRPPPRQNSIENQLSSPGRGPHLLRAESCYATVSDFQDGVGDGISFQAGEKVIVHEKAAGGWWYIQIGDKEGWAPASYIQRQAAKAESGYEDIDEWSEEEDQDSDEEQASKPSSIALSAALNSKLNENQSNKHSSAKPVPPSKRTSYETARPAPPPPKKPEKSDSENISSDLSKATNIPPSVPLTNLSEALKSRFEGGSKDDDNSASSAPSTKKFSSKPIVPPKSKGENAQDQGGVVVTRLPLAKDDSFKKPTPPAKAGNQKRPSAAPPKVPDNPPRSSVKNDVVQNNNVDIPAKPQNIAAALKSKFENKPQQKTGVPPKLPTKSPASNDSTDSHHTSQSIAAMKSMFEKNNSSGSSAKPPPPSGTKPPWSNSKVSKPSFGNKPQLPAKIPSSSKVGGKVSSVKQGFEASKPDKKGEVKNVCASGNVSGLINALGNRLTFGEGQDQSKRRSLTPTEEVESHIPNPTQETFQKPEVKTTNAGGDAERSSQPSKLSFKKVHRTVSMFTAENEGEVGFDEGVVVQVLEKTDTGWWLVKVPEGAEGWAPADYIREEEKPLPGRPAPPPKLKSAGRPMPPKKPS